MKQFTIGDTVTWNSQSNGVSTKKTGQVVGVIPPGHSFWKVMENCNPTGYNILAVKDLGSPRDHESYAVAVPDGKRKPKLYWPRVSGLTLESIDVR